MKVTIYHDESSVDPGATVPGDQIDSVLDSLEAEYAAAILKEYPDAEIEFRREDHLGGAEVEGIDGCAEYLLADDSIRRILEAVYETGNFWP